MPWTTEDLKRLVELEAHQQNVDPRLASAVVSQESEWNPNAVGDNGRSIGLFQLQPAAAKDAGLHPRFRSDPAENIKAGVTYLRQKLDQSKGNVEQALSRYNRGTPDYRGIGDPNYVQNVLKHYPDYQPPAAQKPGIMARVGQALSPASAEASTAPTGGSRLQELEAELARRDAQPPPQAKAPTAQPPTPASEKAAPMTTQAPPAPSPDPTATPGMRFQALPSITQLPPQERIQRQQEFDALKPALQQEFLASEEPNAGGLAVGKGPVAQSQPVTDPAALLAVGRGPARPQAPAVPASTGEPYRTGPGGRIQIAPIQSGASEADLSGADRPHEAGIPLSAVPAIAVNTLGTVSGAALGAPLGPVGSAAGAALGGSLATRANTALGLAPQEKPLLETPWANVYPSDLLGAIPLGVAAGTAGLKGTVRNLPGANVAKHEIAAERLGELGQRLGPSVPSDALWQKAGQSNTAIATADVWRTAGDVVRRKSRTPNLSADDPALKAAQDLLSLAKKHGGPVPIQELDDARRNLVPHLRDPDVKRLYGAVIGDMDNAVTRGVPGAADLRGAIAATRKEHSLSELTDLWSDGKGMQKTSGDVMQVYGKRIRNQFENKMREDKTFAGAFSPEELVDIRGTLRDVGKLTRITNPESAG